MIQSGSIKSIIPATPSNPAWKRTSQSFPKDWDSSKRCTAIFRCHQPKAAMQRLGQVTKPMTWFFSSRVCHMTKIQGFRCWELVVGLPWTPQLGLKLPTYYDFWWSRSHVYPIISHIRLKWGWLYMTYMFSTRFTMSLTFPTTQISFLSDTYPYFWYCNHNYPISIPLNLW